MRKEYSIGIREDRIPMLSIIRYLHEYLAELILYPPVNTKTKNLRYITLPKAKKTSSTHSSSCIVLKFLYSSLLSYFLLPTTDFLLLLHFLLPTTDFFLLPTTDFFFTSYFLLPTTDFFFLTSYLSFLIPHF